MFRKVLIANRGEIAVRITATLRAMGIRAVAVYSEADRGALHARVADEAIPIGPAAPRASYLNIAALVAAARRSGAEAVHPGYGFLAENPDFAAAVEAAGLTFIGPTAEQIRAMGDKRAARGLAVAAGVPVVPGAEDADPARLAARVRDIGYPVIVKAAMGGGGKGMRVVGDDAALDEALASAARVAQAAFGDGTVYVEKRLERARHVEVQVLGDGRGGVIHLFERECSLQRRHQKVIEESPAPGVAPETIERLTRAATALASSVRYRGAGTVEFLLAADGGVHFLEMNTRLQVEHAVTELTCGVDLVRAQLAVAAEGRLPWAQAEVRRSGHAIEARVYAEDPARGFLPQAGDLARLAWPAGDGLRVDRGFEAGDRVPTHYDPLLAKLVGQGRDRAAALAALTSACDATRIHGVVTNLSFLRALLRDPVVRKGACDTEWIERQFLAGFAAVAQAPVPEPAVAAVALAELLGLARPPASPRSKRGAPKPTAFATLGGWRHPGLA